MGVLTLGETLSWEETKQMAEYVRQQGIKEFINLYNKNKNRKDSELKWGDEVEYMIVKFDHNNCKVRLSLRSKDILEIMDRELEEQSTEERSVLWYPEWAAYQLEATPYKPYNLNTNALSDLLEVETNMKCRRQQLKHVLDEDESLLCLTNYPRLGTDDCTHPYTKPDPEISEIKSIFLSDETLNKFTNKYKTIARNIRLRRGFKVVINVPVFRDINTMDPFIEAFDDEVANSEAKVDHIYMDSTTFGSGCSCLQITMLATHIHEAKFIYDQLNNICPLALALSAASPIWRGYLSDRDCRWDVNVESCNCRTKEERGEQPLVNDMFRILKSRYDSIDSYLSKSNDRYNDIVLIYNIQYYEEMVSQGVDPMVAKHIAHLFIRDPLFLFREKIEQDVELETNHFENIQSTNWQTLRFKPPPTPESSIGWRVEFRPMEIQMTEFENAAYAVFIILLSRVILEFKLNMVIPISKVDENMAAAQERDSVNRCKFWFRKDIRSSSNAHKYDNCVDGNEVMTHINSDTSENSIDESCVLMTINEIINGKAIEFEGLVPLIRRYLYDKELDAKSSGRIDQYLNLISSRASGKVKTTAQWIRDFVGQHNDYKHDSVVNDRINYDLLLAFDRIQNGVLDAVSEHLVYRTTESVSN